MANWSGPANSKINAGTTQPKQRKLWTALRRLLGVGAVGALLAGCASGNDSSHESAASTVVEEGLTGTVTVTLATPSPMPVLSPTLVGSTSIYLGAGSEVVTGAVAAMGSASPALHAEPDALLNETWSRGNADLRDRVHIRGTLHAATKTLGNGVVIQASDTTPAFDPPKTISFNVKYPSPNTGAPITLNIGQSQTISPGQYGVVTVNSGGTLTMKAGTYYLKTFDMEASSVVKLDQAAGPVIIYVDTTLVWRGSVQVLPGGGTHPDLAIVYLGTSGFAFETVFDGAIIAPNATLTLRALTAIHTGYFYAKVVNNADAHAKVQYRAPLALIPILNPPGSSCDQLIGSLVPPSEAAADIARYCIICLPANLDTDRDGILNCHDRCPYDAIKKNPGACGCGIPDTDTDGDTVPDCFDKCPYDKGVTSPG